MAIFEAAFLGHWKGLRNWRFLKRGQDPNAPLAIQSSQRKRVGILTTEGGHMSRIRSGVWIVVLCIGVYVVLGGFWPSLPYYLHWMPLSVKNAKLEDENNNLKYEETRLNEANKKLVAEKNRLSSTDLGKENESLRAQVTGLTGDKKELLVEIEQQKIDSAKDANTIQAQKTEYAVLQETNKQERQKLNDRIGELTDANAKLKGQLVAANVAAIQPLPANPVKSSEPSATQPAVTPATQPGAKSTTQPDEPSPKPLPHRDVVAGAAKPAAEVREETELHRVNDPPEIKGKLRYAYRRDGPTEPLHYLYPPIEGPIWSETKKLTPGVTDIRVVGGKSPRGIEISSIYIGANANPLTSNSYASEGGWVLNFESGAVSVGPFHKGTLVMLDASGNFYKVPGYDFEIKKEYEGPTLDMSKEMLKLPQLKMPEPPAAPSREVSPPMPQNVVPVPEEQKLPQQPAPPREPTSTSREPSQMNHTWGGPGFKPLAPASH